MCKYMGWTYRELLETPADVVERAAFHLHQLAGDDSNEG